MKLMSGFGMHKITKEYEKIMDPIFVAEVLETLMIISFGVSWPLSIYRSYTSRSTQGKSVLFLFCIATGYVCGIISKIMLHNLNLAFWFYIPNILMVSTDICLYFRNKKIEAAAK